MALKKGRSWGEPGPLPADAPVARSDAEARELVEAARRAGTEVPTIGLVGGDLCRTLGGRGDPARLRSASAIRTEIDLGAALIDGRLHWFVAHLVARRSWWSGRIYAAMNAQFLGRWDAAPRAHPGDGLVDILDVSMGLGDRVKARPRLAHGTHLPHPKIDTRRVPAAQATFDPELSIYLDGVALGRATNLSVRVEPEALPVVVA